MKPLQRVQLEMLKVVVGFCEQHALRWFLLGGSALGAVRHKGFIPWDDDIDVGLPRPDYDRLLEILKRDLQAPFFLQTRETDLEYPLHFAKVRNSATTFIQSNMAHLRMNHGIGIDLFPLDGYPSSTGRITFWFILFKVMRGMLMHKYGIRSDKRVVRWGMKLVSLPFTTRFLHAAVEWCVRRTDYESSEMIHNWWGAWGIKEVMPKRVFGEGRQVPFESLICRIPTDFESYLSRIYGEYMKLPPEDKRVSHHVSDVIDCEKSYCEYLN